MGAGNQLGGSIRKITIDNVSYTITSDNEPNFTPGGRFNTEEITSNNGPIFMSSVVNGKITGLELKVFNKNGTFKLFIEQSEFTVDEPLSCLIQLADGTKWTAVGGVRIVSDPTDGNYNLATGSVEVSLVAESGEFVEV